MNTVLRDVEQVLRRHDVEFAAGYPAESGTDLAAVLDAGTRGQRSYRVVFKERISAAAVNALPPGTEPLLLLTPYVSRQLAETLRRHDIDFVDQVGNLGLSWPRLYVHVVGNPPPKDVRPRTHRASPAFRPSGTRVLFALLSWRHAPDLTLRELAELSGSSLGTTQLVVSELEHSKYLYGRKGQRRLANGRELFDRWVEAFTTFTADKLAMGQFYDEDPRWWSGAADSLVRDRVQLGGEAAGSIIDDDLRPVTSLLYCDALPADLISERRWRRGEHAPNVAVRRRFWRAADPLESIVPGTLVYADMWASGDSRQRAHAERIRTIDDRLVELDRT